MAENNGIELTELEKEKIRAQLRQLQARGAIDLDAPLRDVLPFIQQHAEEMRMRLENEQDRIKSWYCLIGDIFVICGVEWEW